MKRYGATFRAFFKDRLYEMGFKSNVADPDVLYREATKIDCEKYYDYILGYVDNLIVISSDEL